MTWTPLALPRRSNKSRYGYEGATRLVNAYTETTGADSKNDFATYCFPGLDAWRTPADGATYCLLATETHLYGVTGVTVWAIDLLGTLTTLGTLPVEGPCSMARNRRSPSTEVGLVSVASSRYYVIVGTTLTLITDPDLQGTVSSIAVKDGYFVISTNFSRYFVTGEDNATAIEPLDFAKAQRTPGEISRVVSTENEVVLMKDDAIEWHTNNPSEIGGSPFVPVANINLGLMAPEAVTVLDRTVIWLASDGTVRQMNGYDGQIISTPNITRAIGDVADKSEIVLFAYHVRDIGHSFVEMTCSQWTWVYDITEGMWTERKTYGLTRARGRAAVEWDGMTLIGDYANGTLYEIRGDLTTDAGGEPLVMTIQTPVMDGFPNQVQFNGLMVDVIPGTGLAGTLQDNPQMMMSYSDDGGHTWSAERWASIGRQGQHWARAKWHRLGLCRRNGRTFRFSVSSSVARGVQAASVDVEKLNA